MSPLANSFLKKENISEMEPFYPLLVQICYKCFLVQLPELQTAKHIFREYAYFSSYSQSWLLHVEKYVDNMIDKFGFGSSSYVVEIASNDGYLLKFFKKKNIPVLGIEPALNVADVAESLGIPTEVDFFGVKTAKKIVRKYKQADLLIGNNVLAHVPDLNDFVCGMKTMLSPGGIITMEFPHLMQLMKKNQFDTIYHEHFSYFSFIFIKKVFSKFNLTVFDVDELTTHGGSIRIYVKHDENDQLPEKESVKALIKKEEKAGFMQLDHYLSFNNRVIETKQEILSFMISLKKKGKSISGYGAPAKGNTLLNYCGIRSDFLDYTVDKSPHKQGLFLPGTHIPIYHPDKIKETKPDYIVILPWNLKDEIMDQLSYVRSWRGKFVVLIPHIKVF
jgi:hypothetical protein